MFRLINKVSSRWEAFGRLLTIPEDMLTAWSAECLGIAAKCWMKVMDCWLKGVIARCYPPTWDGLYEMLEDVEYAEEAKQLKEAVKHLPNKEASS